MKRTNTDAGMTNIHPRQGTAREQRAWELEKLDDKVLWHMRRIALFEGQNRLDPVALDTGERVILGVSPAIEYICPTESDARQLAGYHKVQEQGYRARCQELANQPLEVPSSERKSSFVYFATLVLAIALVAGLLWFLTHMTP